MVPPNSRFAPKSQFLCANRKNAFLFSSWDSHDKYTGVVCHSLLQWIMFFSKLSTMTHPSWVALPAGHSFIELCNPLCHHKAVIHEGDHKEGRAPKNWYFQTVVLEKTFESPLDSKEIKPVNPKGNQSWIFIRRTDAEAPILWPPDAKNWLIRKDPDAGKDWRWEDKGITEDEMVEWHHWLNEHEFEQALGD